jgi:mycothiol S-conjugate amidase
MLLHRHNESMADKLRTIMAVHAHPDDESSGTGGVLARYAAAGHRTVLVTCTGGELGEIADPSLAQPENLAEVRRRELEEACAILRVSQLHMLGYRDSGMAGLPENEDPRSFHSADIDEAVGRLVALIRTERPALLISYDEQGFYGHPDHIRANQITVGAWEAAGDGSRYPEQGLAPWAPYKLYYTTIARSGFRAFGEKMRAAGLEPPFGDEEPTLGVADEMITTTVDVTPWVEAKRAALLAHRTQMGANVFFAHLPAWLFNDLFGIERFIRVASRVTTPEREDDLLAGL